MAEKNDPTKDPSTVSPAYEVMSPKWRMISDLLGGTASMRAAGYEYLPQHSAEENAAYIRRLSQTTLYNVTELTLNSLVGRVFREEMKMNDDVPDEIRSFSDDIDRKSTSLSSFAQSCFRESVAKGFAHVLIDMPSLAPDEKNTRTKADDLKDNLRPAWSLVTPENVIFMHWDQEVLMHARIFETYNVMVGFSELVRSQIRVLSPGNWAIWQNKNEGTKKKESDWQEVQSGTYDLPVIPLLTFYTNQTGPMLSKPPLEDLAFMNVRHWQSTSDQINVLTVARFPMLAASGTQIEKGQNGLAIGPRQLLTMRDPNGRFYYVEHSGKAIASGQADLEELEDRMAAYGAEFLRRQVSGRTAFERAQDTNEAISPLKDMALRFQEFINKALALTAEWMDLKGSEAKYPGGTVTVNTKFTEEDETSTALKALGDARNRFDISRKTFIAELIKRGIIEQTSTVEKEMELILDEVKQGPFHPSFLQGQERIMIQDVPGAPPTEQDTPAGRKAKQAKKAAGA